MAATSTTADPEEARRRTSTRLGRKIAVNSSAQAARQLFVAGAGIVSVGVVTRYLPVEQYGGVLAALVLVSLFSVASDFGISAMTVRAMAREPENDVAIASAAFWVWAVFSAVTAVAILGIAQIAYPGPEHEVTRNAVLILMATFPLGPLGGVATTRAMVEQRVWITSLASVMARGMSLLAVVLAATLDLGPLGVTGAFATGFILENAFSIALVRPRVRFGLGLNRDRIASLVVAALPLGTIMVINGLYFRLDAFLLSILGSERDLAVYGVAYKAFDMLISLPGFVMITLIPALASLDPQQPRFQDLVQKAFTGMCIVALPLAGFSILGRDAMTALAGPKYTEGGLVLTLIVLSVAFSCVQGVFGNTLVAQGRQRVLLRVSLSVLALNGLLNLAAIPLFGDIGAAGVLMLSEILSLGFTLVMYHRVAPLPRLHQPVRWLTGLAAMVLAMSVRFVIPGAIPGMLVAGMVGFAAYVGTLAALGALPSYVVNPLVSALRARLPRSVR
jgi:O-antigen/teichoic acid export membrane protein